MQKSEEWIKLGQVLKILPISRNFWWAGVKAGRFPQGVRLGPKVVLWKKSEVEAVLGQQCKSNG